MSHNDDEFENVGPPKGTLIAQLGVGLEDAWLNLKRLPSFLKQNLLYAIAIAVVTGFAFWEIVNAAKGMDRIFPDRSDNVLYLGAMAVVLGFLFMHRKYSQAKRAIDDWKEAKRIDPQTKEIRPESALSWGGTTLAAAGLVLVFVWANVSAESVLTDEDVKQSKDEYNRLVIERNNAQRELDLMSKPIGLEADQVALDAMIAEAKGWGLEDLNSDGNCAQDLEHHRLRNLCNKAASIRVIIKRGEAMETAYTEAEDKKTAAELAVQNYVRKTGNEQYQAMSEMVGGEFTEKEIAGYLLFLIAVFMLWISAKCSDWLLEEWENH